MATYQVATYDDVVEQVLGELRERVEAVREAGIAEECVVVDPGIGFSKRSEHSLAVLAALPRLTSWGYPVLVGASRKRFIGELLGGAPPDDRLDASDSTGERSTSPVDRSTTTLPLAGAVSRPVASCAESRAGSPKSAAAVRSVDSEAYQRGDPTAGRRRPRRARVVAASRCTCGSGMRRSLMLAMCLEMSVGCHTVYEAAFAIGKPCSSVPRSTVWELVTRQRTSVPGREKASPRTVRGDVSGDRRGRSAR